MQKVLERPGFRNDLAGASRKDVEHWADHLVKVVPEKSDVLEDARKLDPRIGDFVLSKTVAGTIAYLFEKPSSVDLRIAYSSPSNPHAKAQAMLDRISPEGLEAQAAKKGVSLESLKKELLTRLERSCSL